VIEGVKSTNGQYIAHIAVRSIESSVPTRTQTLQEARLFAITGTCLMMIVNRSILKGISLPVSQSEQILTDQISSHNELIVDSGCSEHMFNTFRPLTNYVKLNFNIKYVTVANGSNVPVEGYGTCGILKKVYFVPLLSHNLLSVNSGLM